MRNNQNSTERRRYPDEVERERETHATQYHCGGFPATPSGLLANPKSNLAR